ncbi:hypothetical protein N431DRAFT_450272 [Stipitochalara longipes BDJ]|nr:hypothetical protein N431DRAFT_450272 [Stipitochalara longipes BDJ]
MPHINRGTQHHCPGQFRTVDGYPGACRKGKEGFCLTHNKSCPLHPYWFYTMNLGCIICLKTENAEARRERQRRTTHDGEDEESEEEFTIEVRKKMVNRKIRKVEHKIPIPKHKPTANMLKQGKINRRQKRIDIVTALLPNLDLPENPLAVDAPVLLPLPTYEEWRQIATNIVDGAPWVTIRAMLVEEGASEESLPQVSPKASSTPAGKS